MSWEGPVTESPLARRLADASLAALVVVMVGMMIIPLPTWLLDILIATNISIAVLMLLVAMYISGGLQFAAFPTVLLVTTLYRLALNISSTRLILLQADAGEVIDAFGNFVVQGNYVVGAVVFLIITLVQFLVIAKGSERVAEVGARFTLDAMPGKQMSIDAELRTGAIGQDEARDKRQHLQRESQFYGAMDGAMKFVKGDAIAGIVITIINILGGLTIGIAMRGMSAGEALRIYGLLTIGDGLVSQIPALLISTSAGLVVTRVASEQEDASLGSEVAKQIFGDPRSLTIAAVFLFVLAIVPGLPAFPFLVLSAVFGVVALRLNRRAPRGAPGKDGAFPEEEMDLTKGLVPVVVPVALDVGSTLWETLLDQTNGASLLEGEVARLRDESFVELGVMVPGVRTRRADQLTGLGYLISVQEVPVISGSVPEDTPKQEALARVTQDLRGAIRRRARDLVGIQEVQGMLDQLERAYPALVRNVTPKPVSLALLTDVLRRLVEEGVSIRPMREILEALATYAPHEKDPVQLTELVRGSLRRQITHKHARDGVLPVVMLDPAIEDAIRDSIQHTSTGSFLAMQPDVAKEVIANIQRTCADRPEEPLLLTQADVRRFVRRLIEVDLPNAVVLSYQELAPEVTVQPVGRVVL